jgi:hypothetical protein
MKIARYVIAGVAAAVIGTALAGSIGGPARAATTYQVANTNGIGLNVRSGPAGSDAVVGHLAQGQSISITCQTTGTDMNGSSIWDQLTGGGYISDYYTTTPVYAGYSPGLPQCPPAPAASRAAQAIAWYQAHAGSAAYEDYCELAAETAYATSGQYPSAIADWQDAVSRGTAHPGDLNPPAGALVFWNIPGYAYGHVGIAAGDGTFWATSVNGAIGHQSLPYFTGYLGWSEPNF